MSVLRAGAAVFLGVLLLGGCSRQDEAPRVRLWALAPPEVTSVEVPGAAAIRFAVALTISPQEGYRLYGDLAEALGEKVGRPVHLILRRTFPETNDLVRSREADVAQLCSRGFLQGRRDFGLVALAVPVVKGRKTTPSYVVVSAESEVARPGELEGKAFAFADPPCAPEPFVVAREGQRHDGFFRRKLTIPSHDRAIRAVAEGLVEGALVDGLVYRRLGLTDPRQIEKTKIIGETAPYMHPPIVVHPALDTALREELRRAFLSFHADEGGRAVLARLGIDRFEAPVGEPEGRPGPDGTGGLRR